MVLKDEGTRVSKSCVWKFLKRGGTMERKGGSGRNSKMTECRV